MRACSRWPGISGGASPRHSSRKLECRISTSTCARARCAAARAIPPRSERSCWSSARCRSSRASRRSELGLYGSSIDVETGKWIDPTAHIGSGIDSFYEYLVKAGKLFGDDELARAGHDAIAAANSYLSEEDAMGALWYGRVDMTTGKRIASVFGALDAFFPAVLVL